MEKRYVLGFVFVFLAVLFLPGFVEGSLLVTAFSCNDQIGTVVVDNLVSISCQATVNNPDQSTANLNSPVLYPEGNWLESSSYSGSGFETSVSAGASTVVSFTGLTPNVAGLKMFDNINLDGVIDTFVVDTTVNVVDIKTLAISSSLSSGNQNDEFDLQASVTAGGNLDGVTVEADVDNCNLKSGESNSVSIGALNHNNQGSHTWKVLMGNNHCTYTITASGATGSVTTSDSSAGSVTNLNPVTTTTVAGAAGGSSGGGGGGSASGEAKAEEDTGFDIDFSSLDELTFKTLSGQVLSLSFDGVTKHTVTLSNVQEDSVTLIIQSTPKTIVVKIGETVNVDLNDDGLNDMSVTLLGVLGQSANLKFNKLEEGAKALAAEETKARLEGSTTTLLSGEAAVSGKTSLWVFLGILVLLIVIIGIYFRYRHKS